MSEIPATSPAQGPMQAAALAALFDTYADRIYRLALGLLQDTQEAEDVVQETFLKVIAPKRHFDGRSNIATWIYRVAYNASIDRLRQRKEDALPQDPEDGQALPMPSLLVEWQTPEKILLGEEGEGILAGAVRKLPQTLRAVFILRDIDELSTEETAQILEITAGAVKVRLHRARLLLRELLAGYFYERQSRHQPTSIEGVL